METHADTSPEAGILAPADVVRAAFGAYNRGAFDQTARYLATDVEWVVPETILNPGVIRGADELRRLIEAEYEAFSEVRREPLELTEEQGGRVLGTVRARIRGRLSGIELERVAPFAFTVRDGRIVRAEALGVPTAPVASGG